jgi:hypothetical protein
MNNEAKGWWMLAAMGLFMFLSLIVGMYFLPV